MTAEPAATAGAEPAAAATAERPSSRPLLFVVGNSRSGTTLLARILGRHPDVFRASELHFFDRFWSRTDADRVLSVKEATRICAGLCRYQERRGPARCPTVAEAIVASIAPERRTAMTVFTAFLRWLAADHHRGIPCEQTGRTVFYIDEIVSRLPEARIVEIVRDPRDVLLSQKRKWLARSEDKPLRLRFREYTNYHPLTISALWAAAVREGDRYADHPQVHRVRFEDLLHDPAQVVSQMFAFCGLAYDPSVLAVPQVGSSNVPNQRAEKGIDSTRTGRWQEGGIDRAELYLCERVTGRRMRAIGYEPSGVGPDVPRLAYHLATLPLKSGVALVTNATRIGNAREAIARRLRA